MISEAVHTHLLLKIGLIANAEFLLMALHQGHDGGHLLSACSASILLCCFPSAQIISLGLLTTLLGAHMLVNLSGVVTELCSRQLAAEIICAHKCGYFRVAD